MSTDLGLELALDDNTPLVVCGSSCVTRGELRRRADDLVALLARDSIQRALVCSDDPTQILVSIYACTRQNADLYVAHTNIAAEHFAAMLETLDVQLVIHGNDPPRATTAVTALPSRPADGRIFMMTSGTTGLPKVAKHTLSSLLSRIRAGAKMPTDRGAKWLLTYQPTGFAGVQVILTAALTRGTVVVPAQRTPAGFYDAACKAQVTQISGTPTFWRSFLMLARPGELSLRQITLGGEATDQATLDRLKLAFPSARITHTYASTEAGMVYAVHDGRAGFPAAWLEQPIQGVQLRVRDGFLQIKTPNAMQGYVTESAQPLLPDGWLRTADRCEIRGDRVYVVGREDSTINVGGSKVYPLAIETFLLGLPGVLEARVFGVSNPISGFLVGAEVVLGEDQDRNDARMAILAACREKLAQYQVPRVFKIVDAISVGVSGKKVGL